MASMIMGIMDYFTQCPLLSKGYIRVDSLGPRPIEYGIAALPCDPIVKNMSMGLPCGSIFLPSHPASIIRLT